MPEHANQGESESIAGVPQPPDWSGTTLWVAGSIRVRACTNSRQETT